MPLYTTEAIVLRTYKLGEADRIVVFLTRDRGKRRGVAKGSRRPRSRFGGALEPLSRVEVTYFERERRELVSLSDAELLASPLWRGRDEALCHAGYFAELLDECAPEGDADERLYRLGSSAIDALGAGVAVEPLARYFEYWLLRLQGVYPARLACAACGAALGGGSGPAAALLPGERAYCCGACAAAAGSRAFVLSGEAVGFLRASAAVGPERLGQFPVSARALRELEAAHRALIAVHLEKDVRSARVLREIRGPS
ncbi:MAG TPA: DNA repair protein RecO [Vicinamibacterales bacterium]|nr:DNA repair protein RecO [Vicinamibacterales bacterium]HOQ61506.1 DNA repair protein RecO [Vicinamibacterales bacterium]HPW20952.1 DNA repair protein RecO [Vicinamibacterales bacterium]